MKITRLVQLIVALLVIVPLGCATAHPTPGAGGGAHPVPQSLSHTASWLEIFMIVAVPITVAAITMYFLVPEAHRLSFGLGIGGASLFGVSALLRVSLWLVPWLAGLCVALALAALGFEVYLKLGNKPLGFPVRIPPPAPPAPPKT